MALAAALFVLPALACNRVFLAADDLKWWYPWRATGIYDTSTPFLRNVEAQDPVLQTYPVERWGDEQWRQGRLPLWNPLPGAGVPAQALNHTPLYFPPHVLCATLVGGNAGRHLELFLGLWLAGVGMASFLRRLGRSEDAALLGGLTWMLGGWTIAWLEFVSWLWAAAALAWALCQLERLAQKEPRCTLPLALWLGGMLLTGALQSTFFAALVLVPYALYRRTLWRALPACLAGFMLGALVTLPQLELLRQSGRLAPSALDVSTRVTVRELLTLWFPFLFGAPSDAVYLGGDVSSLIVNGREHALYVGFVPCLLALAALGQPRARFWTGLTLLALLVALGTPFSWIALTVCPPLRNIPLSRVVVLIHLGCAVLAAHGWDARPGRRAWLPVGLAMLAGLGLSLAAQNDPTLPLSWLHLEARPLPRPPHAGANFGQLVAAQVDALFRFSSPTLWLPVGWCLLAALCCWKGPRRGLLLLTFLDLSWYGWNLNWPAPAAELYPDTPAWQQLADLRQKFPDSEPRGRLAGVKRPAHPNGVTAHGFNDVAIYFSVMPGRYRELLERVDGEAAPTLAGLFSAPHYTPGLARLLGVGAHYTEPGGEIPTALGPAAAQPDLTVARWDGQRAYAVGSLGRLPREELLTRLLAADFDPRTTVWLEGPAAPIEGRPGPCGMISWSSYDCNRWELEANMKRDGYVLVSDGFYPGWTAQVDGAAAEVLCADHCFRAVAVPAGRHRLVMTYRCRPMEWGAWLGLLALAGLGASRRRLP